MQQDQTQEDQQRVEKLNQRGDRAFFLNELSFIVAGLGGGILGRGFFKKNESLKTSGWTTLVAGMAGVIYSLYEIIKVSSELRKTENTSVATQGKSLELASADRPFGDTPFDDAIDWKSKMADRKTESEKNITPSVSP